MRSLEDIERAKLFIWRNIKGDSIGISRPFLDAREWVTGELEVKSLDVGIALMAKLQEEQCKNKN